MITIFEGAVPSGAMGCRIETVWECYKDMPNGPMLYKSDMGAVICRFGGTLLVCGECEQQDLFDFAALLGIERIEVEGGEISCPDGWKTEKYPMLCRNCEGDQNVAFLASLKSCYQIAVSSDGQFDEQSEYLYWLMQECLPLVIFHIAHQEAFHIHWMHGMHFQLY